jgi:hypothetical protein
MTTEGRGRLFRNTEGRYILYLPQKVVDDSMFPFNGAERVSVKISFSPGGKLIIEKSAISLKI